MSYLRLCDALKTARDPHYAGKPLGNNTRGFIAGDKKIVRYHSTDVLSYSEDGTFVCDCSGWRSITTRQRVTQWSPIKLLQESGEWYVQMRTDIPRPSYPGWPFPEGFDHKAYWRTVRDWEDDAFISFIDGMTFDAQGFVIGVPADRCYSTARPGLDGVARLRDRRTYHRDRKNARAREARAHKKRQREAEIAMVASVGDWEQLARDAGLAPALYQPMFKRATRLSDTEFVSNHGGHYTVGQKTVADDYTADRYCGHGLHFAAWDHVNTTWRSYGDTVLLVLVELEGMIHLAQKVKARSCYVLKVVA